MDMQIMTNSDKVNDMLQGIYLEWLNNYLTVSKFAEDYAMPEETAEYLIGRGRQIHNIRNKPKRVRLDGGVMTSRSAMDQ